MSYTKSTVIPLNGSVSLQPNNFSYHNEHVCYVRLNEVVLLSILTGETRKMPISSKCVVYQASLVNIAATNLLVIASSEGTQIWTVDGVELKFVLPLNNNPSENGDFYFARGIAATENGYICTGTSGGNLIVISVPSRGGEGITFFDSLETKDSPISALCASIALVACGNDNGDIFCFDPNTAFERTCRFSGSGFPCTALCSKEDTIMAAYSSGNIRIYRTGSVQELSVEISAHARCITGLSLHPTLFIAASCGEDQHVHVWSFPDFTSYESAAIDLLSSTVIPNKKLTGISFMSDERIGLVAYDDDEITVLAKT